MFWVKWDHTTQSKWILAVLPSKELPEWPVKTPANVVRVMDLDPEWLKTINVETIEERLDMETIEHLAPIPVNGGGKNFFLLIRIN